MIGAELFVLYEEQAVPRRGHPDARAGAAVRQLVGDVRPDLVITHSAQRPALGPRPGQPRDGVGAAPHAVRSARVPVEPRDERAVALASASASPTSPATIDTKLAAIALPQVAAAQARPRVVARSRARDGPDQRLRVRRGATRCCACGSEHDRARSTTPRSAEVGVPRACRWRAAVHRPRASGAKRC